MVQDYLTLLGVAVAHLLCSELRVAAELAAPPCLREVPGQDPPNAVRAEGSKTDFEVIKVLRFPKASIAPFSLANVLLVPVLHIKT